MWNANRATEVGKRNDSERDKEWKSREKKRTQGILNQIGSTNYNLEYV